MSDPSLTDRSTRLIQDSVELAKEHSHPQVSPVHLLAAFTPDEQDGSPSYLKTVAEKARYEYPVLQRAINQALVRLPSQSPAVDPQISGPFQQVLSAAQKIQKQQKDAYLGQDHLLLALLDDSSTIAPILKTANMDKEALKNAVVSIRGSRRIDSRTADSSQQFEFLSKYAIDLTQKARDGKVDPVIGREEEIRRCIRVLARRTKSNPCLIGDPGVGKTSIVEGVAQRIVDGDIPSVLANCRLFALDLGALKAGAKYQGEFEERIKGVLNDIEESNDMIILFIDEIHMLMGDGKSDAANLLKPMLARGELHCIGATTVDEYRKFVEKDGAFERRFQKIDVPEPTVPQTVAILRGLSSKYELHHGVRILDSALVSAATLASRYLTYRKLPDSAVDLIDEAAASVAVARDSRPEELDSLERELRLVEVEINALERDKKADSAAKERLQGARKRKADIQEQLEPLRARYSQERAGLDELNETKKKLEELEIKALDAERRHDLATSADLRYFAIPDIQKKLEEMENAYKNREGAMLEDVVDSEKVAETAARLTGIPVSKLSEAENQKLVSMERTLNRDVVGQPEAVKAVSNAIRLTRSGLANPNAPASFLFLGLSGSGKTELAKKIAGFLFNDEKAMIRIDCSELSEKHSGSKLIGAAPGYVGYEEGGILTTQLARHPYSVVLLDEVEKAAPDVLTILLQVLDDGIVRASNGKVVTASNALFIMTSNLGASAIQKMPGDKIDPMTQDLVMQAVHAHFRPEFINRISSIIVFNRLSHLAIGKIVDIRLKEIEQRFARNNRKIKLELAKSAREWLAENGWDKDMGARPLNRLIQNEILNPLAILLLRGAVQDGETVKVDVSPSNSGLIVHGNHEVEGLDYDTDMDDIDADLD